MTTQPDAIEKHRAQRAADTADEISTRLRRLLMQGVGRSLAIALVTELGDAKNAVMGGWSAAAVTAASSRLTLARKGAQWWELGPERCPTDGRCSHDHPQTVYGPLSPDGRRRYLTSQCREANWDEVLKPTQPARSTT